MIAARGFRKPLHLRDIPLVLAENGVLAPELAGKLAAAVGLRNRLVHGYSGIDHRILYRVITRELCDLDALAVAIGRLADEESGRAGGG